MPYSKLKTFAKVVERGGVNAAAKALGRTPSAVSQQLRGVQEELGLRLFFVRGGRLQLTESGRLVFELVQRTLPALDQQLLVAQLSPSLVGSVVIGVEFGLLTRALSSRLDALQTFNPELCVTLHLESRRSLLAMLKGRRLDFALLSKPAVGAYELAALAEQVAVVRAPGHGSHDALKLAPVVLREPIVELTQALAAALKDDAAALERSHLVVEGLDASKALVLSGLGIAALPRFLVADELAAGTLVELTQHPGHHTQLYWCARAESLRVPGIRAVWSCVSAPTDATPST